MDELDIKRKLLRVSNYLIKSDEMRRKMEKTIRAKSFCEYLGKNGINYDICIRHQEVLGCDESSKYYERFNEYLEPDYVICKNLLVHERKGEKRNFLIITDSKKKINLIGLKESLGAKKLEFVNEEDMKTLLNTEPGNVSLFNIMYDKAEQVNLIIDQDLFSSSSLAFHPLYNGMSIFLKPEECLKFLKVVNRKFCIMPIDAKELNDGVKYRQLVKSNGR